MSLLLILCSTSLSVKALSFQRIKRSSKICDFENPDIPMSTDEESTLGYYVDDDRLNNNYYRYDASLVRGFLVVNTKMLTR